MINAFKVDNKLQIENAIKENVFFSQRQRTITIRGKKYVELLNIDNIGFIEIDKVIKEIISGIEYSPENYIKLLDENKLLKAQIEKTQEINLTNDLILLKTFTAKIQSPLRIRWGSY